MGDNTNKLLFERPSDGRLDDGLRVEGNDSTLRVATDHEAHSLSREDARALRDAITEWLFDQDARLEESSAERSLGLAEAEFRENRGAGFGPSPDAQSYLRRNRS